MAHEIRVPRLGWSMEEGTFHGWVKQTGNPIQAGDSLFELEGEKALQEIESVDAGTLHILPGGPQPGDTVAVGTLLGYLLAEGELPPSANDGTAAVERNHDPLVPNHSPSRPPAAPSVRRLARQLHVSLSSVTGTGPAGRILADDVRATSRPANAAPPAAKKSSPRGRRIAQQLGIDWTELTGTGAGGRVREADVRRAAHAGATPGATPGANQHQRPAAPSSAALYATTDASPATVRQLSPRRRVIAERMSISRQRTVPVTLVAQADAGNLVNVRKQFKQASRSVVVPAYTDMVTYLAAMVLRRHRELAARWNEDQTSLQLPGEDGFHIGIAVNTPEGLVVPVVRDVARLSFAETVARSRDRIEQARAGTLKASDLQGSVFTVSSLGGYGIGAFTPVINYPEVAILGLGEITREAVVLDDDRIVAAHRVTLSLTFDHRAVDGAPAAEFLRDFCLALENPAPHLLGI